MLFSSGPKSVSILVQLWLLCNLVSIDCPVDRVEVIDLNHLAKRNAPSKRSINEFAPALLRELAHENAIVVVHLCFDPLLLIMLTNRFAFDSLLDHP